MSSQELRRGLSEVNEKLDNLVASQQTRTAPWHHAAGSAEAESLAIVPVRKRVTIDAVQLQGLYSSVRQVSILAEATERYADALSAQVRSEKAACLTAMRRMEHVAEDNGIVLKQEQ